MRNLLLTAFLLPLLLAGEAQAQCASVFFDGFESGGTTPTWTNGGSLTTAVGTTSPAPAAGTYRLEGTGGNTNHLLGLSTAFPAATPTEMSWYMYPNGTAAHNYVVAGNSAVTATNCIVFCYWQGSVGRIRFVSSITYEYIVPVTSQWYFIELKNMNFVTHTFDIWVNGVQQTTNFPFRSNTQNDISRIHLYNFNPGTAYWDNIRVGSGAPFTLSDFVTPPLCNGDTNAAIDMTVTGGAIPFTYAWNNGATTEDLSNITAGTYIISVTDGSGCTDSTSISVVDPAPLSFSAVVTDVTCGGGSNGAIDFTPGGGTGTYSYAWNNGATTQDLSSIIAGTYAISLTDQNGCTGSDSFPVTQPAPYQVTSTLTMPLCNGGNDGAISAAVSGGSGQLFLMWSNGDTGSTTTGLTAGMYTLQVTDTAGCQTLDTINLGQPTPVALGNAVSNPLCNGDNNGNIDLTVTGGTPGYFYTWSNGAATEDLGAVSAGTFSVVVTDSNGCTAADTFQLIDPSPLAGTSNITNATGPGNGAIDFIPSGGTPGYTYAWNTGATTQDISGINAGNYAVTVTDNNGCVATFTFFVDLVIGTAEPGALAVRAWPNPFQVGFSVSLTGIGNEVARLTLTDLQGRALWNGTAQTDARLDVDIDLPSGVYILHVAAEGVTKTLKLQRQ